MQYGLTDSGTVRSAPLFAHDVGAVALATFALSASSPAGGCGMPTLAPPDDVDGKARSGGVDIGADEFWFGTRSEAIVIEHPAGGRHVSACARFFHGAMTGYRLRRSGFSRTVLTAVQAIHFLGTVNCRKYFPKKVELRKFLPLKGLHCLIEEDLP